MQCACGLHPVRTRCLGGSLVDHLHATSGSPLAHLRVTCGSIVDHLRFTFGSIPVHLRCTSGSLAAHFRLMGGSRLICLRCASLVHLQFTLQFTDVSPRVHFADHLPLTRGTPLVHLRPKTISSHSRSRCTCGPPFVHHWLTTGSPLFHRCFTSRSLAAPPCCACGPPAVYL